MPRLIASDLDGTLFGADSQVSAHTREVIRRVTERGHAFVAITGRSWMTAWERLAPVVGIDRMMGSNGACDYRRDHGIVWTRAIAATDASAWAALISARMPSASFGWETGQSIGFDAVFTSETTELDEAAHAADAVWPEAQPLLKLYVRSPELMYADLQYAVRDLLGARAEVSTSGAPFVEVTAAGVDKASALARMAGELGFTMADAIAFGDNHNDVPMLAVAGLSVAMGNAVPEVIAMADRQALNNTQEGVARVLEELLANGEL